MSIDLEELDSIEPTTVNDFRRAAKGVPLVLNEETGKHERYRRSSSIGKILDDETGLTDWKIRTIVAGAAQRPDLMALASTYDFDGQKRELRDIAESCLVQGKGTQRRETGTAVHAMLDHIDKGDEWTPAPQFVDACESYVKVRDAYGLVPVDIECKCVNDEWRVAGTMDRRYRTTRNLIAPDGTIIPIGTVLAGDTKTGRTLEYASGVYATQLAAYASSVRYDPATDTRSEFDPPTYEDWALIVHVDWDNGGCTMHWVDLAAGRIGLALATRVYEWRRRTDLLTPARAPLHAVHETPSDSPAPLVPLTPITPSNGVLEAQPHEDVPTDPPTVGASSAELLAEVRAWLRERISVIVTQGTTATEALQRAWPQGVPGLKVDGHTEAQLDAINHAVCEIEKNYGMTFPPRDPRKVASDAWARPQVANATNDERDELARSIHNHPRRGLLERWSVIGRGALDPNIVDRTALTHALYEFALVNSEWSDDDVTEMLDGTLRGIGYEDGLEALGHVRPEDAPHIMAGAFAITAGTAVLVIREDGKPIVRTIQTL